ncbi:MAG: tripartite tricarboxylate transporter substrate-binding protein [Burkholderiaceae bacterium]|nr:tripartite tricarboxylate transporter substrate-binding protein [Burkholderiaceae bacterium]
MQRRSFIQIAGAGLAASVSSAAFSQNQLSGPITVINPFPPGGGTDTSTRIIMKKLQDNTGIPVVVESKPGGNTLIGMEALVRAAPDGRTIALILNNTTVNEQLYKGKLSYNLFRDIAPLSLTHGNAHVLLVHPSFPANTLQEFIANVKSRPGRVTFGSAGSGSVNHLSGEMLKVMGGLDMVHVPYKGIGTLMPDLLAGRIDALFGALPIGLELTRDKRMKMLAVTTAKRQPEVPDLPAIAELYPGYASSSWFGYAAPGATPPAIVNRLSAELVKVMKDPDTAARLANFQIFGTSPAEFTDFLKKDIQQASQLIIKANVKLD